MTILTTCYAIKKRRYYGGTSTGYHRPDRGQLLHYYGTQLHPRLPPAPTDAAHDGIGRWLYRDDAPYILMTYAQLKFCVSEALLEAGPQG
ncbi:MAG: hypothetical protein MZV63_20630 [Marinilabiliales bacterium]|nr:hypothetical protein [Marinilabiliales bacterium]